jgi:hypothetical protein
MLRLRIMALIGVAVLGGALVGIPAGPAVATLPTAPSPREGMGMAYDAARGQIVLFGGTSGANFLGDTWTWDGTDWSERAPAHAPSKRVIMGMAYDAARGQVVLFGGDGNKGLLGDTWTWDGTDWTERAPAHAPSPREGMGMAYDAARSQIVLFGGDGATVFGDTWTWDGTDWTQRTPAHAPSARVSMGMAYDAARGQVMLFGGTGIQGPIRETWSWDGADWTQRMPRHSPSARRETGMAYDPARSHVVLFGGRISQTLLGDTWTWDGTDWGIPLKASITVTPKSGPPGTVVTVRGSGFGGHERVVITFIDAASGTTKLGVVESEGAGSFTAQVTIPLNATAGRQHVKAKGLGSGQFEKRPFTVT